MPHHKIYNQILSKDLFNISHLASKLGLLSHQRVVLVDAFIISTTIIY